MPSEAPALRILPWLGRSISLLILVLSLATAWKVTRVNFEFPRTDDAEVRANLIGIAPHVGGPLVELHVVDNQEVKQGDLLFVIDPRPYQTALEAAEADLRVARSELQAMSNVVASAEAEVKVREAQLAQAADIVRRYEPLLKTQAIEALSVDTARTDVRTATAQLEAAQQSLARQQFLLGKSGTYFARIAAAEAAVEAARLNVGYCRVVAPFDGRVANLNIAVGRYAEVGQPLFGLLDTRKWYVIANYRETYLKSIRPGAVVEVFLMAYPGHRFRGVVEGIGWAVQTDASTSSGILSESRPDLNWVRLAQRLPVRVLLDPPEPGFPFRMGLTAVTTIRPESARDAGAR
ncbi:MAG: biotin/lipoyl-binding protein [Verrucomicrobiota bacterium]